MLPALLATFARGRRVVPAKGWKVITTKRAAGAVRGFYKGKGARSTGALDSRGEFRVLPQRLPDFVVPDLTGFPLKPYVDANVRPGTK